MIMKACVIVHNMIVEDERDSYGLAFDYEHVEGTTPEPIVRWNHHSCYSAYLHRAVQVQNSEQLAHLQSDLIEEIWSCQLARQIATIVLSTYPVMFFFITSALYVFF